MRCVLVLPLSLGLLACKMENPAFELGSTGSDTGEDDGGTSPDDGAPDDSATGDGGTADDDGDDSGEGTSGSDETDSPGLCDYGRTPPLDIRLGHVPAGGTCTTATAGFFKLNAVVDNGWRVEPCYGDGCSSCSAADIRPLTLWPLDPQDVVSPGCVWIDLEALYDDTDGCRYRGITVWRHGEPTETPTLVGSTIAYGAPVAAVPSLGGFEPVLERLHQCECSEVEDLPACCEEDPPAAYKLLADGQPVHVGESVDVTVGQDAREFEFHNVQSYFQGICGASVQVAWALVRP